MQAHLDTNLHLRGSPDVHMPTAHFWVDTCAHSQKCCCQYFPADADGCCVSNMPTDTPGTPWGEHCVQCMWVLLLVYARGCTSSCLNAAYGLRTPFGLMGQVGGVLGYASSMEVSLGTVPNSC